MFDLSNNRNYNNKSKLKITMRSPPTTSADPNNMNTRRTITKMPTEKTETKLLDKRVDGAKCSSGHDYNIFFSKQSHYLQIAIRPLPRQSKIPGPKQTRGFNSHYLKE